MTAPETQTIEFELDADWATLWLNRPDARNAMSDELVVDLRAQLAHIATRADIRGVTIRGRGDAFCAGGDLKGFKNNFQSERSLEEVIGDSSKMGEFFLAVRSMPQVVVFLLHGAAMAGG
ncbi:MAG: enoyl-CoA hydratase/isomerase family protein, partial [Pseudomonadota bacterium]|nr:enoyl-CoA hydratase/isomerase family protein [Pseudomonadota bacterium]